jgi:hypothetical protein
MRSRVPNSVMALRGRPQPLVPSRGPSGARRLRTAQRDFPGGREGRDALCGIVFGPAGHPRVPGAARVRSGAVDSRPEFQNPLPARDERRQAEPLPPGEQLPDRGGGAWDRTDPDLPSTRGRAGARSRRALRGSSAQWRRTARGRTRDASGISPTAWTARSSRCPVCRFTPVGSTSCCGPPRWSRTAAVDRSSYHVWLCMDILGQARLVPWISVDDLCRGVTCDARCHSDCRGAAWGLRARRRRALRCPPPFATIRVG